MQKPANDMMPDQLVAEMFKVREQIHKNFVGALCRNWPRDSPQRLSACHHIVAAQHVEYLQFWISAILAGNPIPELEPVRLLDSANQLYTYHLLKVQEALDESA
jgi:hypothetical protein